MSTVYHDVGSIYFNDVVTFFKGLEIMNRLKTLLLSFPLLLSSGFSHAITSSDYTPPCPFQNGLIHFEKTTQNMFTTDPKTGSCGYTTDTLDYCHNKMCIYWTYDAADPTLDLTKVLKALNILQNYVDFGSKVMDYDPTQRPYKTFKGTDGITRKWILEMSEALCPGFGGAGINGTSWNGIPKYAFELLYNTVDQASPTVHQIFFYELGRGLYDIKLDNILDWQMQSDGQVGFWTLGFNGAMTVLAPETLGLQTQYNNMGLAEFRAARMKDIDTYINNSNWNFDNAWSVYLLPWSPTQSVNDLMSGLLIRMSDKFGGIPYLSRLFVRLKQQPATPSKTDRKLRATNLYVAARLAYQDLKGDPAVIDQFFKTTLRWTFLPNLIE